MVLIFAIVVVEEDGLATTEEGMNCNAAALKTLAVGGGVNKSDILVGVDSSSLGCGVGDLSGRVGDVSVVELEFVE